MTMNIAKLTAIAALLITIGTLAAASWGAWDLRQEVASNTSWRLIQTFERLSVARKHRRLSQVEWLKWCKAGLEMRIFTVCPTR